MISGQDAASIHKAHTALSEAFGDFLDRLKPDLMLAMHNMEQLCAANAAMKEKLRKWNCLWEIAGPLLVALLADNGSAAARSALAAYQYMQETENPDD